MNPYRTGVRAMPRFPQPESYLPQRPSSTPSRGELIEYRPQIGHEFHSSDDASGPLISFTTMTLMDQAVD